jgi:hypothetical protein
MVVVNELINSFVDISTYPLLEKLTSLVISASLLAKTYDESCTLYPYKVYNMQFLAELAIYTCNYSHTILKMATFGAIVVLIDLMAIGQQNTILQLICM